MTNIANIKTLGFLMIAGAAFASCSVNDEDTYSQANYEGTSSEWSITVNGTNETSLTRALSQNGTTISASWATTEHVYVKKNYTSVGTLTPTTNAATSPLSGTLTGEFAVNDELKLTYPQETIRYTGQKGTLEDIAENYNFATATVNVTSVDTEKKVLTATDATFVNQQAIVKFTLKDKATGEAINATALGFAADGWAGFNVTPESATSEIYVALSGISAKNMTLTAVVGTDIYYYEKASVTFTHGKYYEVTVKMSKKDISGLFYYYVGPENPMDMEGICPIVNNQGQPGWYEIGTSIGTYELASPLLDADSNMIPMGSRTYDYVALPNANLKVYNGSGLSEMDAYEYLGTKVLGGVTYYIYKDLSLLRYFSQYIY